MVDFNHSANGPDDRTLLITRLIDAPPSLVFEMWSTAEHVSQWLGPHGFIATSCTIDFRTGGAYRSCIVSPEGKEYWMRGVYREIVESERIVFTFAWEEEGERGMENLVTIDFADIDGKTKMTFRQTPFQSVAERDGHFGGWTGSFDRLASYLSHKV